MAYILDIEIAGKKSRIIWKKNLFNQDGKPRKMESLPYDARILYRLECRYCGQDSNAVHYGVYTMYGQPVYLCPDCIEPVTKHHKCPFVDGYCTTPNCAEHL